MGFAYARPGAPVVDSETGETLTGWGHHQDPFQHYAIVDVSGEQTFVTALLKNFSEPDNDGRHHVEYAFTDWSRRMPDKRWSRSVEDCEVEIERIGRFLVTESETKTNVYKASWRLAPELRHQA